MTKRPDPTRRKLLQLAACGGGVLAVAPLLAGCGACPGDEARNDSDAAFGSTGPLQGPDANGLLLPEGYRSRIVARSGELVAASSYAWHAAPDGGACFATDDGGWIYVSNSELPDGNGGAGAIRFAANGDIVDAYPVLTGTNRNCAGGPTPWGTWLSCEEVPDGRVWECDPLGLAAATVHPALGVFNHEAAAVDPDTLQVYLTEDESDGRLYRFTPDGINGGRAELGSGRLEVAEVIGQGPAGPVRWHELPDPSGTSGKTRYQVAASTGFLRGEGAWFHGGKLFFCTTGDDRVWSLDTRNDELTLVYDGQCHSPRILSGNDNITVANDGTLLVAEDGGNMQIVTIGTDGELAPFVQVSGHPNSEVAGPAFTPAGDRLLFSSQRGASGRNGDGVTYEISLIA